MTKSTEEQGNNMEKIQKAYDEISKVLDEHKNSCFCVFDVSNFEEKAKVHLSGLELKEVYGLDIDQVAIYSIDCTKFDDYRMIGRWGKKHRKTIPCSVDGMQSEDEILLQISFPTGAYIFDSDFPVDIFRKFWLELKTYKPDYIDEVNHCLYWTLENAKDVLNNFNAILTKYRELNREDSIRRRIEKLEKELEKFRHNCFI